jgi:hypothetical protein
MGLSPAILALYSPLCRGVFRQHPGSRGRSQRPAAILGTVLQQTEDLLGAGRQQLFAGLEEGLDAVPPIADHGRAAGAGLEQTHTGRVAGGLIASRVMFSVKRCET